MSILMEKETPVGTPWLSNLELKPLRFETRTGTFVVVLRILEDTWLGKYRHRGTVTAVTLNGEWNYKEYVFVKVCRRSTNVTLTT